MKSLRIGVNALYLIPGGVGGTEIYLRSLLQAMAELPSLHHFVVVTNRQTGEDLVPKGWVHHEAPVDGRNRVARIVWEQTGLPALAQHYQLDVLLNPGFTAPFRSPCPQVTVFHDLQHVRHPEFFRWWDLPFWNLFLAGSVRASQALIAVSQPTQQDLLTHYRLAPERVTVVPHGVDETLRSLVRKPIPGHLLCVSTLHPHKNLARLVRVFAALGRPELQLTLAGMKGHFAKELEKLIAELGMQHQVCLTGWISREELYNLYATADAFVFPSNFEGFGMPVAEALAAGIPTACSDIPPLRWIAGEAAWRFAPDSDEAMRSALESVLLDEAVRARLACDGPRQVENLTWAQSATKTLHLLGKTAETGRGA